MDLHGLLQGWLYLYLLLLLRQMFVKICNRSKLLKYEMVLDVLVR
jgi:hypothetical protein